MDRPNLSLTPRMHFCCAAWTRGPIQAGGAPAPAMGGPVWLLLTLKFASVRLMYSAKSAAIQQYFSLIINQRTVPSVTINQ
jgi:hypothetical protein